MLKRLKVGILRETKNPPDRRVPLTPAQITSLKERYPFVEFIVQPSNARCYTNQEYDNLNIPIREDVHECDILMGVKEVDKRTFIPGKTYMFFAHVGKKQLHNREMFREMALKNDSLIDYEYLVNEKGERIVAFGRWAGIVGAYNGLRAGGIVTGRFSLKPAYQCRDLDEMNAGLRHAELQPDLKVLITGSGRVANGALETLSACNIVRVSPDDFLNSKFNFPVACMIGPEYYTRHRKGENFSFANFVSHPEEYESAFSPFLAVDLLITGHYWDPRSPALFTKEDMRKPEFRISVIADVTCDVNGSVPSTIRAATIHDPFYGYNPFTENEEPAFSKSSNITVMAVDNLPGELPRDASVDFGNQLINNVMHFLFTDAGSPVIEKAMILRNGKLTPRFTSLDDYLEA